MAARLFREALERRAGDRLRPRGPAQHHLGEDEQVAARPASLGDQVAAVPDALLHGRVQGDADVGDAQGGKAGSWRRTGT